MFEVIAKCSRYRPLDPFPTLLRTSYIDYRRYGNQALGLFPASTPNISRTHGLIMIKLCAGRNQAEEQCIPFLGKIPPDKICQRN